MKKGFFILVFILLFLSLVKAQIYDDVKDMDLSFSIGSSLLLTPLNGANLERLEVFLKLYPKSDYRQEILNFNIRSNPKAETEFNGLVYYKWTELNLNYEYGVDSKIKVKNLFNSLKSRVSFPYTNKDNKLDQFLGETEFIDINDKIRDKAKEVVNDETDYYTAVFKIAEWTRTHVKYDLNTLTADTVQKSSWVFDNREGVCDELTNLFISMLRSVGIPARFVTGVVYADAIAGFGNHGWAEVYFPDVGWLPFDVTFGQYGWVDATHLKLAETADSGDSSVDYKWLSTNLQIQPRNLDLNTKIDRISDKYSSLVKLSILPLNENFKFGSYLPIQVNVQNLEDYYLTTRVYLTKGPSELEEDNNKIVLLKPKESKTVYWLVKLPSDLQSDLVYSSIIEVKETFGDKDAITVSYSNDGKYYSLQDIAEMVRDIETVDDKGVLSELSIDCDKDVGSYRTGDKVKIKCRIKNLDAVQLQNIRVCFNSDCSYERFDINEQKEFDRTIDAVDNVIVTAENKDSIRKTVVKLNYTRVPKLLITQVRPDRVDYGVKTEVLFSLSSNVDAYDIEVDINGYKPLYIDELSGEKEVGLNIDSRYLRNGLKMNIKYKDKIGNSYSYDINYPFIVDKIPWYIKILDKFWF